jgi:hypothetical protein
VISWWDNYPKPIYKLIFITGIRNPNLVSTTKSGQADFLFVSRIKIEDFKNFSELLNAIF